MKPLTRYILLCISLVTMLLPKKIVKACGFYVAPGEYRFWLLQPDLTNEQDLTPFFFASTYLYRGNQYAAKETYIQQNIDEWYREINKKASKEDINKLLNETDPQVFFDHQNQLIIDNKFLRYLSQEQNKELYRYLQLSKKVEQIAANPDPWEEDIFPKSGINNVINEAKALFKEAHSSFVRLRTAYQLTRLYGYNRQPEALAQIYNTNIERVPSKSWIKTAALYQKAIHAQGCESDYLLSKVFDRGGYNRSHCLVRFDSKALDSILRLAKNQHEKNVLYAMKVFNYPGRSLHYIRQIYQHEPTYKELPFLILREINKVEDWLVTNKVTSFETPAVYGNDYWNNSVYQVNAAKNYENDKLYAKELNRFLLQMINEGKNRNKALLQLYASHLFMLEEDYTTARQLLQKAGSSELLPENVKTQIRINHYLLNLENGFDTKVENEFMSIIKTPASQSGIYDPELMRDQLILFTARKMIRQGDRARGLLLLSRTNRALGETPVGYKGVYQEMEAIANASDYDQILNILGKKEKSKFEEYITTGTFSSPTNYYDYYEPETKTWDRNKILDCKASWLIRNHNLEGALTTLRAVPDSFWKQEPYKTYIGGNAFYLNKYHAYSPTKEDKRWLNKKEVVAEMIRLNKLATENKHKAGECYFQLANAWYNMTYYGKNWLMVKQWRSVKDLNEYTTNLKRTAFNDDYFGCQKAKELYLKALQTTKDEKLRALCFIMVEECDRNHYIYQLVLTKKIDYQESAQKKVKTDYKKLRQYGVDGSYYQQLVQECELYQSFIRQYNRSL